MQKCILRAFEDFNKAVFSAPLVGFEDSRLETDTAGCGEAVFASRVQGKHGFDTKHTEKPTLSNFKFDFRRPY